MSGEPSADPHTKGPVDEPRSAHIAPERHQLTPQSRNRISPGRLATVLGSRPGGNVAEELIEGPAPLHRERWRGQLRIGERKGTIPGFHMPALGCPEWT